MYYEHIHAHNKNNAYIHMPNSVYSGKHQTRQTHQWRKLNVFWKWSNQIRVWKETVEKPNVWFVIKQQ